MNNSANNIIIINFYYQYKDLFFLDYLFLRLYLSDIYNNIYQNNSLILNINNK